MYFLNLIISRKKKKHLYKLSVSVFFLVLTLVFGCRQDKTIQNSSEEIQSIKKELSSIFFSERTYKSQVVTREKHFFSENIAFNEVRVYYTEKDMYTFVWIVDVEHTDFDELKNWKLGMIIKPSNRLDFKDIDLEKKGIKTIGVLTTPYILNGDVCIVLRDFKLRPNRFKYIKFYLYNNDNKTNLKYWITEDFEFQL